MNGFHTFRHGLGRHGLGRAACAAALLVGLPLAVLAHDGQHHEDAEPAAAEPAAQEPAAGHGGGGHGGSGYAHGAWPEPSSLGGDFSLTDHTGRKVTLADFKGKPLVLFFGYTQCDDACPLIGKKIGMALDLMGDKAEQVQAAFISVDDRNDGPTELARFVGEMHPRLIGLSGTRKEIFDVTARFRVRRDYIPQNTLVSETPENEEHEHAEGSHGGGGHTAVEQVADAPAKQDTPESGRVKVGFGKQGPQQFHGMEIAHTTHLYLLSAEGKVVKYIYPSMSVEQLAKRLDILADGESI